MTGRYEDLNMAGSVGRWILRGVLALGLVGLAFAGGFLASWFEVQPLHKYANRVEGKLERMSGGPTETEKRVTTLETTFLRLRGEVWPMPKNDWINGGGLTVWGDTLLAMHNSGRVFRFEEGKGLRPTGITPPDSGRAAYIELTQLEAYKDYTHKPKRVRFNDIEYINDPVAGQGLALSYTFFVMDEEENGTAQGR